VFIGTCSVTTTLVSAWVDTAGVLSQAAFSCRSLFRPPTCYMTSMRAKRRGGCAWCAAETTASCCSKWLASASHTPPRARAGRAPPTAQAHPAHILRHSPLRTQCPRKVDTRGGAWQRTARPGAPGESAQDFFYACAVSEQCPALQKLCKRHFLLHIFLNEHMHSRRSGGVIFCEATAQTQLPFYMLQFHVYSLRK